MGRLAPNRFSHRPRRNIPPEVSIISSDAEGSDYNNSKILVLDSSPVRLYSDPASYIESPTGTDYNLISGTDSSPEALNAWGALQRIRTMHEERHVGKTQSTQHQTSLLDKWLAKP
ncbi:hypothetical protein EV182_006791, partial [Spiromyces aspiralis]